MVDAEWNDDELLELLREAMQSARGVPVAFVEAGKAAYAWRTIDAELAALTYDSSWETAEVAATRSESAALRALSFASDEWTIEIELVPDTVLGQLDPPAAGTVSARGHEGELATAQIDDLGFFALRPVPAVPYRLICTTTTGSTILTGWISP
jgi:hypothetical protein